MSILVPTYTNRRRCSKCQRDVELDGRRWIRRQCPDCYAAYNRQWRLDNATAVAERKRQWRLDNAEHIAEYMRQYQQDNRRAVAENHRRYRQSPAGKVARSHADAKRRHRLATSTLYPAWFVEQRREQQGRCAYCFVPIFDDLERGHPQCQTIDEIIPLSKGGQREPENCVLACWTCNCSKNARNLLEWLTDDFSRKL